MYRLCSCDIRGNCGRFSTTLPKLEVAGSTPVRRLQWQSDIWLWNALTQHEVLN
jgi:hypothetical protein